jgi:hypothetical protein
MGPGSTTLLTWDWQVRLYTVSRYKLLDGGAREGLLSIWCLHAERMRYFAVCDPLDPNCNPSVFNTQVRKPCADQQIACKLL